MNEVIDWSKAPKDATHAAQPQGGSICWYKVVDGGGYFFSYSSGNYGFDFWDTGDGDRPLHEPLIPRPAKAWNGTGLPPVGTVCEWLSCIQIGAQEVSILAYSGGDAWIEPDARADRG